MEEPRYTEAEWRTIDDMRRYWNAICDCDVVPIDTDDLKERMEAIGLVRWRKATKRDVQDIHFAADLGIEVGGMIWELTAKGRKLMEKADARTVA